MAYRVNLCRRCQEGDETVTCMRESDDGFACEIAERMDDVLPGNILAIEIFTQAQLSAEQVSAKKKTYIYLRPADIKALMDIHAVPIEDRALLMGKIMMLQDLANNLRPDRPKAKAPRKRSYRG